MTKLCVSNTYPQISSLLHAQLISSRRNRANVPLTLRYHDYKNNPNRRKQEAQTTHKPEPITDFSKGIKVLKENIKKGGGKKDKNRSEESNTVQGTIPV